MNIMNMTLIHNFRLGRKKCHAASSQTHLRKTRPIWKTVRRTISLIVLMAVSSNCMNHNSGNNMVTISKVANRIGVFKITLGESWSWAEFGREFAGRILKPMPTFDQGETKTGVFAVFRESGRISGKHLSLKEGTIFFETEACRNAINTGISPQKRTIYGQHKDLYLKRIQLEINSEQYRRKKMAVGTRLEVLSNKKWYMGRVYEASSNGVAVEYKLESGQVQRKAFNRMSAELRPITSGKRLTRRTQNKQGTPIPRNRKRSSSQSRPKPHKTTLNLRKTTNVGRTRAASVTPRHNKAKSAQDLMNARLYFANLLKHYFKGEGFQKSIAYCVDELMPQFERQTDTMKDFWSKKVKGGWLRNRMIGFQKEPASSQKQGRAVKPKQVARSHSRARQPRLSAVTHEAKSTPRATEVKNQKGTLDLDGLLRAVVENSETSHQLVEAAKGLTKSDREEIEQQKKWVTKLKEKRVPRLHTTAEQREEELHTSEKTNNEYVVKTYDDTEFDSITLPCSSLSNRKANGDRVKFNVKFNEKTKVRLYDTDKHTKATGMRANAVMRDTEETIVDKIVKFKARQFGIKWATDSKGNVIVAEVTPGSYAETEKVQPMFRLVRIGESNPRKKHPFEVHEVGTFKREERLPKVKALLAKMKSSSMVTLSFCTVNSADHRAIPEDWKAKDEDGPTRPADRTNPIVETVVLEA